MEEIIANVKTLVFEFEAFVKETYGDEKKEEGIVRRIE